MSRAMPVRHLGDLLTHAVRRHADRIALADDRGEPWTYAELDRQAERVAAWLRSRRIGRGDRVGICLRKSRWAVAAIHGILRVGAAYVPTDAGGPATRAALILADADVRALIVEAETDTDRAQSIADAWQGPMPPRLSLGESEGANDHDDHADPLPPRDPNDLAYVLYTSGSTGRPKGVTLSHANALCFLDWCLATFDLRPGDRFSSHAPFHFDLSVFDLYASCAVGGTLVLLSETLGKDPARLGDFLAESPIDVWYSAPSILALMTEHGRIDRDRFPAPRLVLFAGEVFPIRPLKTLRKTWPNATLWNLYGPTETNVCTAYRLPAFIDDDHRDPFPIGPVCPPLEARVVDENGVVEPGAEGELQITGPGVMQGYLGRDDLTRAAFQIDEDGRSWYRTGDVVVELNGDDGYQYRGRRDRMVKRRGYRIELGEIESALARHEDIERAAVVSRTDESGVTIGAFVAMRPGRKGSIIALKRYCAGALPTSMVPDRFTFLPMLPSTSTDKMDYPALLRLLESGPIPA